MSEAAASPRAGSVVRSVAGLLRTELLAVVAALAAFVMAWQLCAWALQPDWLPEFTTVASRVVDLLGDAEFRAACRESLYDVLWGYGISVLIGLVAGVSMGLSSYVNSALKHYLDVLLFIPPILSAPVFLIVFGISRTALLAVIVVFASTVMVENCRLAVQHADAGLVEMSTVFGSSRPGTLLLVVTRGALPQVFTGLQLGMARAVKGMIIGELFLAVVGLGAFEARFQSTFDSVGVLAVAVVVASAAIVLSWALKVLDHIVNYWLYDQ